MPDLTSPRPFACDNLVIGASAPKSAESSRARNAQFPLLLALANDESAAAAIRCSEALARSRGAVPTVVRALGDVRALEASVEPLAGVVVEEYLGPDYLDECRRGLEQQVTSVAGDVGWELEVTDDAPIDAIVDRARAMRASLIVMGLRRHGVLRRVITRDLLAEVVRVARVPVLAVRPELTGLPRRVVVAIDFGIASIRAAFLARELLADVGVLFLVHVTPVNSDEARAHLNHIIEDLRLSPQMTASAILLHGDVQSAIEGCAMAVGADLLAAGSEEHTLMDRLTVGSTSMKLARGARWSTLIVPLQMDEATPPAARA
jgi:nucleotide-binding universal stress UspA family protein